MYQLPKGHHGSIVQILNLLYVHMYCIGKDVFGNLPSPEIIPFVTRWIFLSFNWKLMYRFFSTISSLMALIRIVRNLL
jgi:hypothetical protein